MFLLSQLEFQIKVFLTKRKDAIKTHTKIHMATSSSIGLMCCISHAKSRWMKYCLTIGFSTFHPPPQTKQTSGINHARFILICLLSHSQPHSNSPSFQRLIRQDMYTLVFSTLVAKSTCLPRLCCPCERNLFLFVKQSHSV